MYRAIDCNTWDDPWFSELDPSAKLLFLYLITNRRSTPCGAFEITLRAASFETGIPRTQLDDLLKALAPRVVWYPEHNAIWLRNFYKHQKCNENYRKGAANAAANMPESVRVAIYQTYPELLPGIAQPHETVDALPEPTKGAGEPLSNRSEPLSNRSEPLPNRMQTGGKEEEKSRVEKRTEEEQDAPNGAAALPPGDNAVKIFIDLFTDKIGEPPDIPPRFTKPLKETMSRVGRDRYRAAICAFLSDGWGSETGYSVQTFVSMPVDRWTRAEPKTPVRASPASKNGAASSAEYYTARIDGILGGSRA